MIETKRLLIKRYEVKDKADFIALFTDAVVMKHVGDGVLTRAQAAAFWKKLFVALYPQNFNIWAIFARENLQYVGHAGIYPRKLRQEDWELVYFLRRNSWGKGYATELTRRIIQFGFDDLELCEVFATVDDDHPASIKVLEKAGMTLKNYEYDEEGRFSVYSIKK